MELAPAVLVRRAVESDLANLRSILHETYAATWLPQVTDQAANAFRDEDRPASYVALRGLLFWVAERGREVIGFVDLEGDFVNALHVRPSAQRTGVGRALMDFAESEALRAGFNTVRLETDSFNDQSRAFYEARGYVELDRFPEREFDSGLTTLLLAKKL